MVDLQYRWPQITFTRKIINKAINLMEYCPHHRNQSLKGRLSGIPKIKILNYYLFVISNEQLLCSVLTAFGQWVPVDRNTQAMRTMKCSNNSNNFLPLLLCVHVFARNTHRLNVNIFVSFHWIVIKITHSPSVCVCCERKILISSNWINCCLCDITQ